MRRPGAARLHDLPRLGSLTLAEPVAYLEAEQPARQKVPERLEIVSEFPMTPSGKIQKFRLRQLVAEKLAKESGERSASRWS